MSGIDWSKAPAGATHWEPDSGCISASWMRLEGDTWFYWPPRPDSPNHSWRVAGSDLSDERVAAMISRPSTPAWTGTGLPPVGTVCMVYAHNTRWGMQSTSGCEREILAYHGEFVWLGIHGAPLETTRIDKVDFKPICTPEQIAAEEQEKEIDALCSDIVSHYEAPKMSEHYLGLAKALHKAGYRKTEAP